MSNSPRETMPPETASEEPPPLSLANPTHWLSLLLIGGVRLYQIFLGPLLGGRCRFYPSCSRYFILAVRKYGAVSGATRGLLRILRCHPFHPGGYDPP